MHYYEIEYADRLHNYISNDTCIFAVAVFLELIKHIIGCPILAPLCLVAAEFFKC